MKTCQRCGKTCYFLDNCGLCESCQDEIITLIIHQTCFKCPFCGKDICSVLCYHCGKIMANFSPRTETIQAASQNQLSTLKHWKKIHFKDTGTRTSERQKNIIVTLEKYIDYDLFVLSGGIGCQFCAARTGRVYSKTGLSPIFPPLALALQKIDKNGPDLLSNTYLVPHPNCLCSFTPWTPAGRTEEEIQKIKDFSSPIKNPFDHDPRTPEQIEALKRKTKGRKKVLKDYRLFQHCQQYCIEGLPKTFTTFQKHKRQHSEKYQKWMNQYSVLVAKSKK